MHGSIKNAEAWGVPVDPNQCSFGVGAQQTSMIGELHRTQVVLLSRLRTYPSSDKVPGKVQHPASRISAILQKISGKPALLLRADNSRVGKIDLRKTARQSEC